MAEMLPSKGSEVRTSCDQMSCRLLLDLSAHYGSAAARRGGGKRVGAITSQKAEFSSSLWKGKATYRLLCPHCGLWMNAVTTQRLDIGCGMPSEKVCVRCLEQHIVGQGQRLLLRNEDVDLDQIMKERLNMCKVASHRRKRKKAAKKSALSSLPTSNGKRQSVNAVPKPPLAIPKGPIRLPKKQKAPGKVDMKAKAPPSSANAARDALKHLGL